MKRVVLISVLLSISMILTSCSSKGQLVIREEFVEDEPITDFSYTSNEVYTEFDMRYSKIKDINATYTDLDLGAKLAEINITLTDDQITKAHAYIFNPKNGITMRTSFGKRLADTPDNVERETLSQLIKDEQDKGLEVLAAINGSFFKINDADLGPGDRKGSPKDLVLKNGWIISSDAGRRAAGFYSDGTLIIGRPNSTIQVKVNDARKYEISQINKSIQMSGITLYTSDFSDTTGTIFPCTEVVARITGGRLKYGETLNAVVEKVNKNTKSTKLNDGYIVLSAAEGGSRDIEKIKKGDKLSINIETTDLRWINVMHGVGGDDKLLHNGYVVNGDRTHDARTAIGTKEDGTVVLLAVDGVQSGYSAGLSKPDTGVVLQWLGCVEGLNLDGGASSTLAVNVNGSLKVVNKPLEGTERQISNGLVFYKKK